MTSSLADVAHDTRVFIDANIFVYHLSADSRLNSACTGFLASVEQVRLVGITSAAVVQETSHRVMIAEALLTCPQKPGTSSQTPLASPVLKSSRPTRVGREAHMPYRISDARHEQNALLT